MGTRRPESRYLLVLRDRFTSVYITLQAPDDVDFPRAHQAQEATNKCLRHRREKDNIRLSDSRLKGAFECSAR